MDWGFEELQLAIEEISLGERLDSVEFQTGKDGDLDTLDVLLKYPSKAQLLLADLEQRKFLRINRNFPTEEQVMKAIVERGLWSEDDDKHIEKLRVQINLRQKKIVDPKLEEAHKGYIREAIEKFENQIFEIELKKERMLQHTAERKARQAKYDWLVWAVTLDPYTRKHIWFDYLTYYNTVSVGLKSELLSCVLRFLSGHSTEQIRFIARSNLWRIQYLSATKSQSSLFGNAVASFTPDQLNLVWWSSYYQSVYEMLPEDQPPNYVIEDDEALDKYMSNIHNERENERNLRRDKHRRGGNSAMNSDMVFVFKSHEDYEHLHYDKAPQIKKKGAADTTLQEDIQKRGKLRKIAKGRAKIKKYQRS